MQQTEHAVVINDHSPAATKPRWFYPAVVVAAFLILGGALAVWANAATTTSSLFSNSDVPKTLADPDNQSVEVGVRFKAKVSGQVTAVKFYKSALNTGTHTGSLWDNKGNRLAVVTFTNETSSGWQTATFPQPVTIAANVPYIVSYHAPKGHYATTENYFAKSGHSSGELTANRNSSGNPNGVYKYGSIPAYPTDSFKATNYWVDAVFTSKLIHSVAKPAPPVSVTAAASSAGITVSWSASISANPVSNYLVLRGGTNIATVGGNTLTYSDSKVTAGQTYAYQIVAVDNTGVKSDVSNTATATYNVVPPTPAPTPTPTPPVTPPVTTGSCDPNAAPTAPAYLSSWPTAANTGPGANTVYKNIPADVTSGPGWTYQVTPAGEVDVVISGDCVDFSGYKFSGSIYIQGKHDMIHDNDLSNPGGNSWVVYIRPAGINAYIANNYIHGPTAQGPSCLNYGVDGDSGADSSAQGSLVLRNHFNNIDHPLQQERGTVQDNFVEHVCNNGDPANGSGATTHSDDFFSGGGTAYQLNILHNWLVNDDTGDGATASIILSTSFGPQNYRKIDANMLGGNCGFGFYGGGTGANASSSDVVFTNNQFTTKYNPNGGYYGYARNFGGTGYVWSGNTWADGPKAGQTVAAP